MQKGQISAFQILLSKTIDIFGQVITFTCTVVTQNIGHLISWWPFDFDYNELKLIFCLGAVQANVHFVQDR